jgi:phosphatidylglycerophosphate synthase
MIAIPLVLLNDFPFRFIYGDSCPQYLTVTAFVVYLATLVSLVSGIIYVVQNKKVLKN